MRLDAHAVQNQNVQILQARNRFFGNKIQIRRVCKIVETISDDGQFAVYDFERRNEQIFADAERRIVLDCVRNELRQTAAEMRRLKNILKNAPQILPGDFVGENAHRAVSEIERADVVKPENVVNVAVRNQNRVEKFYARAQGLLPEIYRSIDENSFSGVFDEDGNAQAFVLRIVRPASFAIASDRRNAGRCACAEKGQFHSE